MPKLERDAEKARAGAFNIKIQQPCALKSLLTAPSSCVSRQHLRQLDLLGKFPLNLYEELAVHLNSANNHRSSLPFLEVLSLAGSCCGDAAVLAILSALSNHPKLSVLDLSSCCLTDAAGKRISSVIRAQAAAAAQLEWATTLRSGIHNKASKAGPAHARDKLAAEAAAGRQQAPKTAEQASCADSSKGLREIDLSSNQLTSSTLSTLALALANRHCCVTLLNLSFNPQLPTAQHAANELQTALVQDGPPQRLAIQLLQHATPSPAAEDTKLVSGSGSIVAPAAASLQPWRAANLVGKLPPSLAAVAVRAQTAQLGSLASNLPMHRVLSGSRKKTGGGGHTGPLQIASTATSRPAPVQVQGVNSVAQNMANSSSSGRRSAAGVNAPTNEGLQLWAGVFVWHGATANAQLEHCTRQQQQRVQQRLQQRLQSTPLVRASCGRTPPDDPSTVGGHQQLNMKQLQQQLQLRVACTKQQPTQGTDKAIASLNAQDTVSAPSSAAIHKLSLSCSPAGPTKTAEGHADCAAKKLGSADCDGAAAQPAKGGLPVQCGYLKLTSEQGSDPGIRHLYLEGCPSDCHAHCCTQAIPAPTWPHLPEQLEPQQQRQEQQLHASHGKHVSQLQELLFAEDSEAFGGEPDARAAHDSLQQGLQPARLHVAPVQRVTVDDASRSSQHCPPQVQQRYSRSPGTPLGAAPGCIHCSTLGCSTESSGAQLEGRHARLPDTHCHLPLIAGCDVQAACVFGRKVSKQLEVYQHWMKQHWMKQHQAPLHACAARPSTSKAVPSQQKARRQLHSRTVVQHPVACEQQQQWCMGTAGTPQRSELHAKHHDGAGSSAMWIRVAGASCTKPASQPAGVIDEFPGPGVCAAAEACDAKSTAAASPRHQHQCQQPDLVNPPAGSPGLPAELVELALIMCDLTDQVTCLESLVHGNMLSESRAIQQLH